MVNYTTSYSIVEAEYYGVVKGGSIFFAAMSMARDLGIELEGRIHTDSSAAKGIASHRGLGMTRHIHVNYLWIQERLNSGDFQLFKEKTDNNVGDLFTKYLDQSKLNKFVKQLSYAFLEGRSKLTLKAAMT